MRIHIIDNCKQWSDHVVIFMRADALSKADAEKIVSLFDEYRLLATVEAEEWNGTLGDVRTLLERDYDLVDCDLDDPAASMRRIDAVKTTIATLPEPFQSRVREQFLLHWNWRQHFSEEGR